MLLTQEELRSLVDLKTASPHRLLGLHALNDGSGLVARALLPNAAEVEIQPVHEKDKPPAEFKPASLMQPLYLACFPVSSK